MSSSLDRIMAALTVEEKEVAARSSYAYLQQSITGDVSQRDAYACKMAQLYLHSKKDRSAAEENLRETLAFRRDYDLDTLRLEPHRLYGTLSERLVYVQGHDRDGRALWIGVPRKTRNHDVTETITAAVFTMEKAIACSQTRGHENITAILHYMGIDRMKEKQPLSVARQVLHILRRHYVGRVHRIFLVDAPWTLRTIWRILKPFAGRSTRQKVVFVTGDAEKEAVLGPIVDPEHAANWMLPQGKLLQQDFNLHLYLNGTAFDKTYGEKN